MLRINLNQNSKDSILIRLLLFLLVVLLGNSRLYAGLNQGEIKGRVLDHAHDPVFGVSIALEQSGRGTITDGDGSFHLKGLPEGRHVLLTSAIGFRPLKVETVIEAGQPIQELTLIMEAAVMELDEVKVHGKSHAALQRDRGFAISGVEMSGLEQQSLQANDVLDRTAGVRIRQEGGMGSDVQYNINGLSGRSIKIFLNGVPIENYGASFSLSSIPTSLIERIEVYKGVVPAYLGDDALGGAINVVTKKQYHNNLNMSYSFGSFHTHQATIDGRYREDKTGFTFQANAFYNYSDNNYKVWGEKVYVINEQGKKDYLVARRFHDRYRSGGLGFDMGFTGVKWADELLVGGVFSAMDKEIQHGVTMEIVYGNRASSQQTALLHAKYRKQEFLSEKLSLDFFASYAVLGRQLTDTIDFIYNWKGERVFNIHSGEWNRWSSGAEGGEPTLNRDDERKLSARLKLQYTFNEANRISFNMSSSDFSRQPDDPLRPESERALIDTRYLNKKVLAMNYENAALDERLKTTLFFKYYYQHVRLKDAVRSRVDGLSSVEYDVHNHDKGYGSALSYALFPQLIISASAEHALRLPSGSELFGNAAANIEPAYNLQAERSKNFNLGFVAGPFKMEGHRLGLGSNLFYRDISGMIKRGVPDQFSEATPHVNLDRVRSTGIDVELDYFYGEQLSWSSNMALSNPRFNREFDDSGARFNYYGDRLRNEPYFTANSLLTYRIDKFILPGDHCTLSYNLAYVHEFFRNWESLGGANKDIIPSQLTHDVAMVYDFPGQKLSLSIDLRNLLNEQVFDNWALQKPGRAFYAKIAYKIN